MGKLKSTIGKFNRTRLVGSSKKSKPVRGLITGAITALIGTALVVKTANALNRL